MPARPWRYPKGMREAVYQRDNHACRIRLPGCTGTPTDLDHIVPVKDGGMTSMDNLRAACHECNQARANGGPRRAYTPPERW